MATKKAATVKASTALPEHSTSEIEFLEPMRDAVKARQTAATAKIAEDQARERIEQHAVTCRETLEKEGRYIGLIRVVDPEQQSNRIEFRVHNGSLAVTEGPTLDKLYGPLRPQLFEKASVVTEVHDPAALYKALVEAGQDPWSVLKVSVKDGMDGLVSKYDGVISAEAYLPKKGMLTRLDEHGPNLSADAKEYTHNYLQVVLKPTVILGTK